MEQIGGKLLGNGSIYTTLFKPSIQCKNKDIIVKIKMYLKYFMEMIHMMTQKVSFLLIN